ncbi:MAG TPA: aldehyde dehydrogenase family protein [Stenomitos sp.]
MTLTHRPTPAATFPNLGDRLATPALNYVAGRWEEASSGATFAVRNPAMPSEVLGRFPESAPADVARAITAAQDAFHTWSRLPAPQRGQVIARAIALLKERAEELAHALSWESGKVLAEARVEVTRGLNAMEYLVAEARRQAGQTIPSELPGTVTYTVRRPLGVVGLITPWNFPFAIPAWKVVPALVTGNTVVMKPAEQTPVCTALIVQAFDEAGLPSGVLNLVNGGPAVGEAIVADPAIKAISFTGSTAVGKLINQRASARLAKVQLELGGKNAAIVLDDADLDLAAREIAMGAWGTTGQRCTATSRVIVMKGVASALLDRLKTHAAALKVGHGLEDGRTMGPLINQEALDKVERYVAIARQEGATVLCGGERLGGELSEGYFYAPTLLTGVKPHHTVANEEIFGPVLSVIEVGSCEEALQVANSVPYGLSSAVFTRDVGRVFGYAEALETGLLHVNCATVLSEVHLPFGGMKDSGFGGREMGPTVIDFFTEWQTMYLRHL